MRRDATPTERFDAWFVRSIEKLKELPEGDGAFAAMMIALPLYERLIFARLKVAGRSTAQEDIARAIGDDLGLSQAERKVFWDMFRVGFMHRGMVKAGRTQWLVSHKFGAEPEFRTYAGQRCVCVDPWKFADRVLAAFSEDTRLITASESFPLADVFALDANALPPPAGQ